MDKYSIVKAAIDRADPDGLLEIGAPSDEYDSESEEIAKKISGDNSVEEIAETAAKIFSRTFNSAFLPDRFMEAAAEILREFERKSKCQ